MPAALDGGFLLKQAKSMAPLGVLVTQRRGGEKRKSEKKHFLNIIRSSIFLEEC